MLLRNSQNVVLTRWFCFLDGQFTRNVKVNISLFDATRWFIINLMYLKCLIFMPKENFKKFIGLEPALK